MMTNIYFSFGRCLKPALTSVHGAGGRGHILRGSFVRVSVEIRQLKRFWVIFTIPWCAGLMAHV